jgi:hypothetical protein
MKVTAVEGELADECRFWIEIGVAARELRGRGVWLPKPIWDLLYQFYLVSSPWKDIREQVIRRCDGMCEECGSFTFLNIHHLTYDRVFMEDLKDLKALCDECHAEVHQRKAV